MARAYHIGKIEFIFRKGDQTLAADASTQALMEMWDEGSLVVDVHPVLSANANPGQFALVEYAIDSPQLSINTITKILDSKQGEQAWKRMKQFHEKRKKAIALAQGMDPSESAGDARMVR